jgi:hypothetical protein
MRLTADYTRGRKDHNTNHHTRDAIKNVGSCFLLFRQPRTHANRPKTLQLFAEDDGESLGSCSIDTADLTAEFIRAGAGFFGELLRDRVQQQPVEVDEGVHIDDRDSVLGTQNIPEDLPEPEAAEKASACHTM